jgi:hypothetical protein
VFYFAGDLPYSFDMQPYLFDLISERNAIVRQQSRLNCAGVVDLAAVFDTEGLADFREDFFDVLHLRPRAYPKAAAAVYSGIRKRDPVRLKRIEHWRGNWRIRPG